MLVSLILISIVAAVLLGYGVYEYQKHQRIIHSIPIRIHVNGTRGKSSVTRLIGAGLRAGGYSTITKVTGTFPRLILTDGTEVAIHRREGANIIEQLSVAAYAAKEKTDVLLIECMALQPQYQRITEHQMIHATHGVITNIRLDHLDVMGPGLKDVGIALANTIPKDSKLYTAENRMLSFLEKRAAKLGTTVYPASDIKVTMEDMEGFTYFEHPENVALALSICDDFGIDRALALAAMKETIPDEGVLRKFTHYYDLNKKVVFYNAFAANDPESSKMIWDNVTEMEGGSNQYVALLNARKDRKERSVQLIELISTLDFDYLAITGENTDLVKQMALKRNIDQSKILDIGLKESDIQANDIISVLQKDCIIVALGNMGAGGAELSQYFEHKNVI